MPATDLADIHLPTVAVNELRNADQVEWVDGHTIAVGRQWWTNALTERGLKDPILGEKISRADIFAIADPALNDPAAALSLLWNSLAWGSGDRRRNNRARIASVAEDPDAAGGLLQRAARISCTDPMAAYDLLLPNNRTAIRHLGPAFFTKCLYFAGGGHPGHRCYILDENVALSLNRTCGWTSLPTKSWLATAYERYALLLDLWITKHQISRGDVIERWLFENGKTVRR